MSKRFARGTKVRIAWTNQRGESRFTIRWWHQVDAFIRRYSFEQGQNFRVKGHGWKDWQPYDPRDR